MKKTQACRHQRVEFARWADVAIIGSFLSGLRHHFFVHNSWHQSWQHGMVGRSGKVLPAFGFGCSGLVQIVYQVRMAKP